MKTIFTLAITLTFLSFLYATTFNENRYASKKSPYKVENKIDTPNQDRFVKVKLVQGEFTEPTELAVLPNLDILVTQRRGEVMIYKNSTKKLTLAGKLDVYFKTSTPDVNAEEGLLGLAPDPKFALHYQLLG